VMFTTKRDLRRSGASARRGVCGKRRCGTAVLRDGRKSLSRRLAHVWEVTVAAAGGCGRAQSLARADSSWRPHPAAARWAGAVRPGRSSCALSR
jgi:hypothetical protein